MNEILQPQFVMQTLSKYGAANSSPYMSFSDFGSYRFGSDVSPTA